MTGLRPDAAVDALFAAAKAAPSPAPPEFVLGTWTNTALRVPGMTSAEYQAKRKAQQVSNQGELEQLRHWWLREMIGGQAPLRENLVLFLHGTIGGSTGSTDMPQAVHGTNALLRRSAFGAIPALLEQLVVDPGVMIQIGIDELRRDRDPEGNILSHRAARIILDNWMVGPGAYTEADAVNLSAALTGWLLVAPAGQEPKVAADPTAFRSARRTGLVPVLQRDQFEAGPKTILGTTEHFDARSAIRFLARHPLTARRYSTRLIRYFGVEDPDGRLEQRLIDTYRANDGSLEALVRAVVLSEQFWAAESRWNLLKSPIHLVVGACRQLGLTEPPMNDVIGWLAATGQKLFDTPNFGNTGWSGQEEWVTPSDRLARRYQLGSVLAGRTPKPGGKTMNESGRPTATALARLASHEASVQALLKRLDPAPGVDVSGIERQVSAVGAAERIPETVRQILSTRQYQLA
jgi:uncharacterized protein (DUF1800 family)